MHYNNQSIPTINLTKRAKNKRGDYGQIGVFAAEILEHLFVRGAEVINVRFSERRTGKLNVLASAVRGDVEALSLEECVGFHAPILVGRANHCVPVLHLPYVFLYRW